MNQMSGEAKPPERDPSEPTEQPGDDRSANEAGGSALMRGLVLVIAIALVLGAAAWFGVDQVTAFGNGDPLRISALFVFALLGGIGYLLSGRVGLVLLVVIAAIAMLSIGVVSMGPNTGLDPMLVERGMYAAPYAIGVVFVLAGSCIFGGWMHWGFVRAPRARAPKTENVN